MSLVQLAVRGAAWTMALNMAGRALGLLGTLVITHYLAPQQIGEVQVAVVLVTTANFFSLLGMGHYIVAKPHEGREAAFHSTVITLALGVIALAITVLARDWLAARFDAPAAARFLPALALSILLDRIAFVPTRVLVRDMRFRTAGLVRTAGELVFPAVAVGLAVRGWGGEALVAANVVRALVRTAATVAAVQPREWLWPCRLNLAKTREILAFGLPNGVASLAGFASGSWDNLLMARLFGAAELGYYQLAYQLSALPSQQVGEHVGDVLLPSYARVPPERRGPALARSVRLLALLMFPMSIGLGLMAPTIVAAFLDARWGPVGDRVTVLAALSAVYPIGYTVHSYLNAANLPRWVMWLGVGRALALLGSMALLGAAGGPLWACGGVGAAFGAYMVAGLVVASRAGSVSPAAVLKGLAPPLAACVPMGAAVLLARYGLRAAGVASPAAYVAAELLAGAIVFVAAALLIATALVREFLQIAATLLPRRRTAVAPEPEPRVVA